MNKTIATYNQSVFDLSIQFYGSATNAFDFAVANDISLTDDIIPGLYFDLPDLSIDSKPQQDYFKKQNRIIATANSQDLSGNNVFIIDPSVAESNLKKPIYNQSIIDIALQETGTIESALQLCLLNNLSITDQLELGIELNVEVEKEMIDIDILKYYKSKGLKPATSFTVENLITNTLFEFGLFEFGLFE